MLERKYKKNLSRQGAGITSVLMGVLDCGQDFVLVHGDIAWAACSLASSNAGLSSSDATGC